MSMNAEEKRVWTMLHDLTATIPEYERVPEMSTWQRALKHWNLIKGHTHQEREPLNQLEMDEVKAIEKIF